MKFHTPETIFRPLARYSHAVEVEAGARLLFVSGQLALDQAGRVPDGVAAQAELIFRNIDNILQAAGMGLGDLVRISTFLTHPDDLKTYMAVRDRFIAAPPPASTLLVISGFSRPEFKIEIEVVAAKSA
jgi:enamine deaminase RidA (YjgF/YER057c/UK114 family)